MPLPHTVQGVIHRAILVLPALALAMVLAGTPFGVSAQSDTSNAEDDPVVARVNGDEIRRSEVFALVQTLPQQFQSQLAQVYPLLVQRLVDFRLAQVAGRAAGLADDHEVKARLVEAEKRFIRDIWIERAVNALTTDDALQVRYADYLTANPPASELHARHILLESEEEARGIITKLDGGEDFAALAKEHSTGPSGPRGGDLGFFTPDQMVPEFSAAASALEPGQHSKDPVKTQFGWHIIKVEERRKKTPPSFDDMEAQLRQELAGENVEAVLSGLRESAEIEITEAGSGLAPGAGAAQ